MGPAHAHQVHPVHQGQRLQRLPRGSAHQLMQLRRPAGDLRGAKLGGRSHGFQPMVDWFKEWIEDQGQWALLKCGHKCDLKERGQMTLRGVKRGDLLVICEKCWQIPAVERYLSYAEYRGIPTAVIPDE